MKQIALQHHPNDSRILIVDDGICQTLSQRMGTGGGNVPLILEIYEEQNDNSTGCDMDTAVRRLMPIECERLQGYEDNWTLIGEPEENPKTGEIEYFYIDSNGKKKKVSDSARYKALGNSICLPFWEWMARRICSQYERKVTMGSLFDGIGGFPLVFQNVGAFPIWASEIEEFPMAVTKERFPEDE